MVGGYIKNAKTCKITLGVTDESGAVKNYYGYSELSEIDFSNMSDTNSDTNSTTTEIESPKNDLPIHLYREITEDKLKLYFDGLNANYLKNFNKKHSINRNNILRYGVSFGFYKNGDKDFESVSFSIDPKDYITATFASYYGNKIESISYYNINDKTLTSGFCVTIYNKDIVSALKKLKNIAMIDIYASLDIDGDGVTDKDQNFSSDSYYYFSDNLNIKTITGVKKSISDLAISSISSKTYTGKARKPSVTIKDGSKTLKYGTDYTLTYSNNTNIGTATVTIKGKGDYTGSKKVSFKIVPPKTTLSVNKANGKYTLSWKAISGIDKYQIKYSDDNGKTYKSAGTVASSKTKVTYTLKTDKSYIFRIRSYKKVNGKIYYSEWTEYDYTAGTSTSNSSANAASIKAIAQKILPLGNIVFYTQN